MLVSHLQEQFERIVLLNKADAAGAVRPGVDVGTLARQLQDLDFIALYRGDNLQKIFPRSTALAVVSPPTLLVQFPVAISIADVLKITRSFSGIKGYQMDSNPGRLILKMQAAPVAELMYGLQVPTSLGTILFTSGDRQRDSQVTLSFDARKDEILRISPLPELSIGNIADSQFPSPMVGLRSGNGRPRSPGLPPP
jgi:hypothetical protein